MAINNSEPDQSGDDNNQNENQKTERIRQLNDAARKSLSGLVVTSGVRDLPLDFQMQLFRELKNYNNFNADNDPYNEHDFGTILHGGGKFFWKIDYYDTSLKYHSEDASNPCITRRIITLMLAEEY